MHDFCNINKMLNAILNGIDPSTGEVFDRRDMYNNAQLKNVLYRLYMIASGKMKPESRNLLNRDSNAIFNELKEWRLDKAKELSVPAFVIFSDKELLSIAKGDICKIEDLLLVKGIQNTRYEEYGKEIFEILKKYL